MKKEKRRSALSNIHPWKLSAMTLVILFILLSLMENLTKDGSKTIDNIGYTFCFIFVVVACFIICKIHPKSIWYTVIICNAVGIMALIMYVFTDLSNDFELKYWGSMIVLSTIGAITGSFLGKRSKKRAI